MSLKVNGAIQKFAFLLSSAFVIGPALDDETGKKMFPDLIQPGSISTLLPIMQAGSSFMHFL